MPSAARPHLRAEGCGVVGVLCWFAWLVGLAGLWMRESFLSAEICAAFLDVSVHVISLPGCLFVGAQNLVNWCPNHVMWQA